MSMDGIEPTPDQLAVISDPPGLFVRACPGAGKTRTIALRFVRVVRELAGHRGVAVLSFTNAAAEEIGHRCHVLGSPRLAAFPSFIGTIDGFINRFVLLPLAAGTGTRPRVIESWKAIGALPVRPMGKLVDPVVQKFGVGLDSCLCDSIDWSSVKPPPLRSALRAQPELVDQVLAEATRTKARYWSSGYLTCTDARTRGLSGLKDPEIARHIGAALRGRFVEVIVDEVQDCNVEDLALLEWLRAQGVPLVLVCDPDQSIFGFRGGCRNRVVEFGESLGNTRILMDNFRSSKEICAVSATLRSGQLSPDRPAGNAAKTTGRVVLLSYASKPDARLGLKFASIAQSDGVSPGACMVLAHQAAVAESAAGVSHVDEGPSNRCGRLATAKETWAAGSRDRRAWAAALRSVEILLLQLLQGRKVHGDPEVVAGQTGVDYRWLVRTALSLIASLPTLPAAREKGGEWACQALRAHLGEIIPPLGVWDWSQLVGLAREKLPTRPTSRSGATTLLPSTTHKAKGREFEAVLFVVPSQRPSPEPTVPGLFQTDDESEDPEGTGRLLDDWESGIDSEAKRVAYVACTRPKRLLAVGVCRNDVPRVRAILDRAECVFEETFVEGAVQSVDESRSKATDDERRGMHNLKARKAKTRKVDDQQNLL